MKKFSISLANPIKSLNFARIITFILWKKCRVNNNSFCL